MKPFKLILNESNLRLKDIAEVKTDFSDADFWIVRRGSDKTVGGVTKDFNKEHIGIKVLSTDIIDANYLYYMMMNFHMQGIYKSMAKGTLKLVNITIKDIQNIKLG